MAVWVLKPGTAELQALDFVYLAMRSLGGDVTHPYLHATALNAAVQSALGLRTEEAYMTGNGAADYKALLSGKPFYLTPFRPVSLRYVSQAITGNHEPYLGAVAQGEILAYQSLRLVTPGSTWAGVVVATAPLPTDQLLRVGRQRGLCRLRLDEIRTVERTSLQEGEFPLTHPGDPLVHRIIRGVMVTMAPYCVVEVPTVVGKVCNTGNARHPAYVGVPEHLIA